MLDDKVFLNTVEYIKKGVEPRRAATASGVTDEQWKALKRQARLSKEPAFSQWQSIEEAVAIFEAEMISKIYANKEWRSASELLQKRFNERWGQKVQVEVKAELDKILNAAQEVLPQDWYIKLLERLSEDAGEGSTQPSAGLEPQLH